MNESNGDEEERGGANHRGTGGRRGAAATATRRALPRRRARMLPLIRKKNLPRIEESPGETDAVLEEHKMEIEESSQTSPQVEATSTFDEESQDASKQEEEDDDEDGGDDDDDNDGDAMSSEHTEDEEENTEEKDDDVAEEAAEDSHESSHDQPRLEARLKDGQSVLVRIVVNNLPFELEEHESYTTPARGSKQSSNTLGNDGNFSYCNVCGGYGDIVCCDGCPRVYHPKCIPKQNPSRQALDNDEDPWFCPECFKDNNNMEGEDSSQRGGLERRATKRKCNECQKSGGGIPVVPCLGDCGVYLHHPSCRISDESDDDEADRAAGPLCSNCRAEQVLSQEEMEKEVAEADSDEETSSKKFKRRRARARSLDSASLGADELSLADDEEDPEARLKRKRKRSEKRHKKKHSRSSSSKRSRSHSRKKKKKSKRKRTESFSADIASEEPSASPTTQYEDILPSRLFVPSGGPVRATPAFFFFLGENRFKIERSLSRKHRYFNRMPKSVERNELIAREGALWWSRLRPSEHRRYMNMSMRDFEQRIKDWKEERIIREMTGGDNFDGVDGGGEKDLIAGEDGLHQSLPQDERVTEAHHQRLYLSTSVGSKPFAPEAGKSNNRVLLELLQDMRFHPEPLFRAARPEMEQGQLDHSKMTVPHFDVHGPISSCVGDECLGCTRGWNHFCPVLKRRFPAVEHRARLQPPLSSLMATRIGLGLRPRLPKEQDEGDSTPSSDDLFSFRENSESLEAKKLPPIPSFTLAEPSDRVDDAVTFIEEALAVKVPEPPRPWETRESIQKPLLSRGELPTIDTRKQNTADTLASVENGDSGQAELLNKCGRCRAVIRGETGCFQCRRAQLVINTSKRQPSGNSPLHGQRQSKGDGKTLGHLKVQTTMLGRLTVKDSNFDAQSRGDNAIGKAILGMRWSPNAVLPPQKVQVPKPHTVPTDEDESVASMSLSPDDDSQPGEGDMMDEVVAATAPPAADPSDDVDVQMIDEGGDLGVDQGVDQVIVPSEVNEEAQDEGMSLGGRPIRSARVKAAASVLGTQEVAESPDRQQLAKEHKEAANELYRKCLSIAISGILLALMRRDPLELFADPVSNVEGYEKVVKTPIDFGKIRSKVLKNKYPSLGAFVSDARLLCTNALAFNHPSSVYSKTAKELYDLLEIMQKRASNWMSAIRNAHEKAWRRSQHRGRGEGEVDASEEDPFQELRTTWPEAVEMLENGDWLRREIAADFLRTKENETAYYGSLAVRRAALAAELSLAAYPDSAGVHSVVVKRSHVEDEALRQLINKRVAEASVPVELKDIPSWREEAIIRVLRRVQNRRIEGRVTSESGCARCDSVWLAQESKMAMAAETLRWGRNKRKGEVGEVPRVVASRRALSTGFASNATHEKVLKWREESKKEETPMEPIDEVAVSVRGSRIHGWGLFADQPFIKGDVVAEYVGEYITNAVADAREQMYQEHRIQDYQFRVDEGLVIDATLKGGHGRYINHNCNPNCVAKIVEGKPPNRHLKRVMITAQRDIQTGEEITYDYQFPLELDLDSRIPCNCGSTLCRGFMNWDLPEKGSKNRLKRTQKRGGNMRDRIRRLGRPLKKETQNQDE